MAERSIVVRLRAEVADYKRQMAEAARETNKIPESAARAETALGRMVQSARYNREAWDRAGRTMLGFGAATIGGLALATKAAIDWESAWTGVLKTVDGTGSELDALEGSLREMARTLPATHEEIAAVAEAAGQLGIATPNVATFTRTMIDLGETTNLSAQEAATGLARFANVMGTSQQDFDRLGSVIVGLGNNFATTEREILDMAQRLASASRVVGLTEADVLALATAMSSVGIEAEAGGSAISRVMIKIAGAVDEGGADLEEFARVAGVSSEAFASKWRTAPVDALLAVVGGLARMTETGQGTFSMLDELGLRDIRITNAMLSLSNATDLTTRAVEMSSEEWARNSALLLEAEKRYDTAAARLEVAKGSINDAAITLGQVFLPAVADAAEGVAGFAQWLGDLPPWVQNAAGSVGALTGGVATLGGGFLLLFPRLMEARTHFQNLGTAAQSTLKGIGATVALVAAAAALLEVADAAQTATLSSEELLNRLVAIEGEGAAINTLFSDIGQGWADAPMRQLLDPSSVDDFRESLEKLNGPSIGFVSWLNDIAGIDGGLRQFGIRLGQVGDELGGIARTDLPRATAMFNQLVDAAGGGDEAVRLLLNRMPEYRDALYSVANAQGLVLDETGLLALATGDLELPMDRAAAAQSRMAAESEYLAEAEAAATEALQEWRDMVAASDASFVDLTGAYRDAEAAAAQFGETATVTSADYIASLEAQVAAQEAWETNMLTIAQRVREGMTGEMATAGEAMIDELLAAGPEGAAAVALLATMTDEEFRHVVELWGDRGTEAVTEFTRQVESYRQPEIDVTANLTPAESQMRDFVNRQWSARVRFDFSAGSGLTPRVVHLGQMADGGPVPGVAPHPRADNVLVRLTSGEYVHQVPAVNYWGRGFMDAVNRMDKAAVAAQVAGYAYGGQVGAPASAPVPVVYSPGAPGRSAPLVGQMVVNEVTDGIGTAHTVLRYVESLGV